MLCEQSDVVPQLHCFTPLCAVPCCLVQLQRSVIHCLACNICDAKVCDADNGFLTYVANGDASTSSCVVWYCTAIAVPLPALFVLTHLMDM